MRGVITLSEVDMILEHKVLHNTLKDSGYKIVQAVHSGRTLYTTYSAQDNERPYTIVQWFWDLQIGWCPLIKAEQISY